MLKRPITYTDYNGVERTENFYFNLSKAEIMEMEMGTVGGFAEMIQRIVDAQDGPKIMSCFKEVLMKSYGVRSDDGKRFMKKKPDGTLYADDFVETEAYSELFMTLVTDANEAAKFIKGIIPVDVDDDVIAKAGIPVPVN